MIALIVTASCVLFASGYYIGRFDGVKAERLRIDHIFDIAFNIVVSGALRKVYRRITGAYKTDHELCVELKALRGRVDRY